MNSNPEFKAEQYASSQYDVNQYTEPDSVKGTGWTDCRDAFIAGYEADRWIPVTAERPKNDTSVLLSNITDGWVVAGYRDGKVYYNQFEDNHSDSFIIPTHWQPLPKTPTL